MQAKTVSAAVPILDPALADLADGPAVIAVVAAAAPRTTPTHAHARGQLLGAIAGLLSIDTEQERLIVPPGHAIWLPPGHRHSLRAHGPCQAWSVYVAPPACADLPSLPQVVAVSGLLREAVLRAASWRAADAEAVIGALVGSAVRSASSHSAARARIAAVILDEIASLPRQRLTLPLPSERRLLKIAQQLAADPADPRSLPEWAAWVGIAPRTLTRRFALETGLAFSTWRTRARLMRAIELLAAGGAVTSVALELGYDSLSAFISMFRRSLGVSPGKFNAAAEPAPSWP
ncbi:AraC family transcriptional regulator [Rugamonas rubra]|uniref:AraC-type DNA-binding protein n=1 Tax=Rugamonas rubra TaxID=758825 RepID=A0A1I4K407_9BURK|nr:helix-turn-helix transcriptional regulator [Rugamonas rubra]SFL73514.1 AraC-type DNA-binding protein [Rugamonas rubra]